MSRLHCDFLEPSEQLYNRSKALDPKRGAVTELDVKPLRTGADIRHALEVLADNQRDRMGLHPRGGWEAYCQRRPGLAATRARTAPQPIARPKTVYPNMLEGTPEDIRSVDPAEMLMRYRHFGTNGRRPQLARSQTVPHAPSSWPSADEIRRLLQNQPADADESAAGYRIEPRLSKAKTSTNPGDLSLDFTGYGVTETLLKARAPRPSELKMPQQCVVPVLSSYRGPKTTIRRNHTTPKPPSEQYEPLLPPVRYRDATYSKNNMSPHLNLQLSARLPPNTTIAR